MTAAKSPWVAGLTASFLPWLDTDIVGNSVMYAYGRVAQSPVFEGKRGKLNIFLLLHVKQNKERARGGQRQGQSKSTDARAYDAWGKG